MTPDQIRRVARHWWHYWLAGVMMGIVATLVDEVVLLVPALMFVLVAALLGEVDEAIKGGGA